MSETVPGSQSRSIGEMLDDLKEEFPDVTISKIRFLESQGLLDPERTASGYRKFRPADVERLRWILRQQRENFLPLKVIKGRLEAEGDAVIGAPDRAPSASGGGHAGSATEDGPLPADDDEAPEVSADATPADDAASATLSRDELARASELSPADLVQLERHGLLVGGSVGGQLYYDREALVVARLAAAFARHGVEPRHLRMYKNSAEREAGFYEQVVAPLKKQRNPDARRRAAETLAELAELGDGLRKALLRTALADLDAEPKRPRRRS
ncbi:MAG: transcriptional regulator FtsR [Acidimicrobiales bacterium]|jgi:DNA-binding transcriptional MerR regulator